MEGIIVGIEIGTSKICVAVCDSRRDGSMRIMGTADQPARGVRKGEIIDLDNCHKCLSDVLSLAEERSDVKIRSVFVGVSGGHILGHNHHTFLQLDPNGEEIFEDHLDDLRLKAREESVAGERVLLELLPQNYALEGQNKITNPVGMFARRIDAGFHVISGHRGRVQNTVRCLREFGLEVSGVFSNAYASSLVTTTEEQRELGLLHIDMGGGTTDYIAYTEGVVRISGSLGIGGDHITNDVSMGLRVPIAIAEKLKVAEASLDVATSMPGDMITIKSDPSYAGKDVSRDLLNTIVSARVRETLEVVQKRLDADGITPYLGAGVVITGGCSLLEGLVGCAEEVFGMPVVLGRPKVGGSGGSGLDHPSLATPIGIARLGQIKMSEEAGSGPLEAVKNFFQNIFGGG